MAVFGVLLRSRWKIFMFYLLVSQLATTVNAKSDDETLESECRPFVEKALKDQLSRGVDSSGSPESVETGPDEQPLVDTEPPPLDTTNEDSQETIAIEPEDLTVSIDSQESSSPESLEQADQPESSEETLAPQSSEDFQADAPVETSTEASSESVTEDVQSVEAADEPVIENKEDEAASDTTESKSNEDETVETTPEESQEQSTIPEEQGGSEETQESLDTQQDEPVPEEEPQDTLESQETQSAETVETTESSETVEVADETVETVEATEPIESVESNEPKETEEVPKVVSESAEGSETSETPAQAESAETVEEVEQVAEATEVEVSAEATEASSEAVTSSETSGEADEVEKSSEDANENDLIKEFEIPENLRPRDTIVEILHLDEESSENELALAKAADNTLRELKRLYDNAIKPLEILYKYRDLSNRHFGDPEIFSKPLILFMGPWSGGKSSIINYLLDNDYKETSLKTGAEPSPAYFNIVMWGAEPEVLDGTQLAADWTFSGLQKFGQGLEDRLRGLKLPHKLLEMVNIVEIPGILEVRKQVSRVFPFNDACQWFIDRADVIFLVYDPSKLDVGPETEAILDQLKGREYQTRVILNKADTVKPEELLRVQGALIWNISPLMSSPQPPIIYTTSLWSTPYNPASPVRLLQAQEKAFLRDIRQAIDRRVENKISSARRFAVRVRNHAKMVDCYLTTYYNHKTFFGNRKQIADEIIEKPQDYHIYEGLSTLKNISRYDLPDPDAYRDFFKINPLYEFQPLSATCTYFKGCPINRLDICIAYDLPELVGKHKKAVDQFIGKAPSNS